MINLYKYSDFYIILIRDKNVLNWLAWELALTSANVYYDSDVQNYYNVQTLTHILIQFFYNKIIINHNFKLKMFINS